VWFRYSSTGAWDNVVSRNPQVCWECIPAGGGQGTCVRYNVEIRYWQKRQVNGCAEEGPYSSFYTLWGPISVYLAEPRNECGGVFDMIRASCRGNGASCGATQDISLNRLFRISRFQAIFTRVDGQQDQVGNRTFRVYDQGGTLYQQSAPTCPQVRITCDEECPPGTEPFCGGCCNCQPLLNEARSIQSLIRSL
jgi:hypothetical protein